MYHGRKSNDVSILILLDVVLEVLKLLLAKDLQLTFQSLFCWMLFWKNTNENHDGDAPFVSILILLDVVLEEYMLAILLWLIYSFNPYSVGCCSGRNVGGGFGGQAREFQSLFCWMLFWKGWAPCRAYRGWWVSILILLDVVLEVQKLLQQVLPHCSFNPYSVGCCSGSLLVVSFRIVGMKFQSLFCWMLFWKFILAEALRFDFVVSILILLDVVLEVLVATLPLISFMCFNPYSVGCCSGSITAASLYHH